MSEKESKPHKRIVITPPATESQIEALCRTWSEVGRAILMRRKRKDEAEPPSESGRLYPSV